MRLGPCDWTLGHNRKEACMYYPSKSVRFGQFVEALIAAPAANSRQAAFDLMKQVMDSVENMNGLPSNNYVDRMNVFPMEEFYEWTNLTGDPCRWVDSLAKRHCTEIYDSGRIVITRIKDAAVILDKSGA